MHRLLVPAEALSDASPTLSKEAARHLMVLRPEAGEPIELFDGHGHCRVYRYDAQLRVLSAPEPLRSVPPPCPLTLFACVTKGSRWDWTVEKATELGVTRIVPVISDRTIVRLPRSERAAKRERWLRIAEDAARQSNALWIPEISEAVDFQESLVLVRETCCFVGALTSPPPQPLVQACRTWRDQGGTDALSVYIGPEGDFTPEELSSLLAVATPTSFGPTILRAETAALFAISVAQSVLNA